MKKIKGFTRYSITKEGEIYSDYSKRFLKGGLDKDGYRQTILCEKGKRKNVRFHKLVAEYFIDNNENLPVINHIDGVKLNNNVDNLEWCTISHNTKEAYRLGFLCQSGEHNNACKFGDTVVEQVVQLHKGGMSIPCISKELGLKYATTYSYVRGLRRS